MPILTVTHIYGISTPVTDRKVPVAVAVSDPAEHSKISESARFHSEILRLHVVILLRLTENQ